MRWVTDKQLAFLLAFLSALVMVCIILGLFSVINK